MIRVQFLRRAVIDASEASRWYAERDPKVADAFEGCLERTVERVASLPGTGSPWPGLPTVRRAPIQGFPYWVIYEELAGNIVVIAVAHEKRQPGYWREA